MIITIEGQENAGAWAIPQNELERERMASFVEAVGDVPTRCATCAFRPGTDANRSRLVLHLVEMCLVGRQPFMCHCGEAPGTRPCAGFKALEARAEPRDGVLALFKARVLATLAAGRSVPQLSLTPGNDKGPQTQASEVLESTEVTQPSTRATGRD
jgi:hypothetical protein